MENKNIKWDDVANYLKSLGIYDLDLVIGFINKLKNIKEAK